jgi:hypothetical protein
VEQAKSKRQKKEKWFLLVVTCNTCMLAFSKERSLEHVHTP